MKRIWHLFINSFPMRDATTEKCAIQITKRIKICSFYRPSVKRWVRFSERPRKMAPLSKFAIPRHVVSFCTVGAPVCHSPPTVNLTDASGGNHAAFLLLPYRGALLFIHHFSLVKFSLVGDRREDKGVRRRRKKELSCQRL